MVQKLQFFSPGENKMKTNRLKCFFVFLWILVSFPVFAGFELDTSFWKITNSKTSLDKWVYETGETPGNDLNHSLSYIQAGGSVLELESDANKYMFSLSYQFEENFHRLRVGVDYAGSGSQEVNSVSWSEQIKDFQELSLKNTTFDAKNMEYTNVYASYRLLPFEGDNVSNNSVSEEGLDLILSWVEYDQSFTVLGYFDQVNHEVSTYARLSDFNVQASSIGFGVGGTTGIFSDILEADGRVIYYPFFDWEGSAWEFQFKISYYLWEDLGIFIGGKWFQLQADTQCTFNFVSDRVGSYNEDYTFEGLNVDLGGYVLGLSLKF